MKSTLLVFDIDGTLIQTGAGRRAFNGAFERVFGLPQAARTVRMAGRTDPAIHRELCEVHGLDPSRFAEWKPEFLAQLADALRADRGRVLPGVRELLEACDSPFALALGTGNVEEGARLKLAAHDLNGFFPTGGFGGDGESRDEVIARAIARATERHGHRFDRVVVIGDTPHDIACGKANGCLTVGVATGPQYSVDELRACGADLVFPDLSAHAEVLERLGAYAGG